MRTLLLALCFSLALSGCMPPSMPDTPDVPPAEVVKSLVSWLYYDQYHMRWYADYAPRDTGDHPISKEQFLGDLVTGRFYPVRLQTKDSAVAYRLYPLGDGVNKEVQEAIQQKAHQLLGFLKQEGAPLPSFHFTDLDGRPIDTTMAKGKIMVMNCWFIHCQSCVAEMPALNRLAAEFADRKDMMFVGLTFDSAGPVRTFLQKTPFSYDIVSVPEVYIEDSLKVPSYPTQIIVDKSGRIAKMIGGTVEDLRSVLLKF